MKRELKKELQERKGIGQNIRLDKRSELIRVLDEGYSEELCQALETLCPCRNRVYDREVWQRIFEARNSDDPRVRHQASHAIDTLLQRAPHDQRSLQLLLKLKRDFGEDFGKRIPWSSFNIGLYGPRSRPSRRKHMTYSKRGRWKAQAFLQFESLLNKESENSDENTAYPVLEAASPLSQTSMAEGVVAHQARPSELLER
jgi:hypothetical protein